MSQRNHNLYIAPSEIHGYGVFCSKMINEGEIIEICPVLILPQSELEHISKTKLYNYYFIWGEKDDQIAIILGYGSLYNHSYLPNAEYFPDIKSSTLDVYAFKDIMPGEEIFVNYNGDPNDKTKVWFDE